MKKLSEKGLSSIQESQRLFNQTKMQLGDKELEKQALLAKITEIKEEFAKSESELIEKYGKDSTINMETGEVLTKEESDAKKELETKPLEKVE